MRDAMTRLTPNQLRDEQATTLASPVMRYGLLVTMFFKAIDLLYGRRRSWSKFRVLELIARVPYQAWEHVAYIAITHIHEQADFARRIFERVQECRRQQDNEQWHLLILEEWVHRQKIPEGFVRYRVIPQVIAFAYYQISWLLYVIKPEWSYWVNAAFEDHAEREYMLFVREHPELDSIPFDSAFRRDYGEFSTMGDVIRQIGYDERIHKEESLAKIGTARFT